MKPCGIRCIRITFTHFILTRLYMVRHNNEIIQLCPIVFIFGIALTIQPSNRFLSKKDTFCIRTTYRVTQDHHYHPHHIRMHVHLQVSAAQAPVPVVSDVASVHNLAKQVTQILPWHLVSEQRVKYSRSS